MLLVPTATSITVWLSGTPVKTGEARIPPASGLWLPDIFPAFSVPRTDPTFVGYREIPAGGIRPQAHTGRGSHPACPPPLYPHRKVLPDSRVAH